MKSMKDAIVHGLFYNFANDFKKELYNISYKNYFRPYAFYIYCKIIVYHYYTMHILW
jgi:hypothetical protein